MRAAKKIGLISREASIGAMQISIARATYSMQKITASTSATRIPLPPGTPGIDAASHDSVVWSYALVYHRQQHDYDLLLSLLRVALCEDWDYYYARHEHGLDCSQSNISILWCSNLACRFLSGQNSEECQHQLDRGLMQFPRLQQPLLPALYPQWFPTIIIM